MIPLVTHFHKRVKPNLSYQTYSSEPLFFEQVFSKNHGSQQLTLPALGLSRNPPLHWN